MTNKEFCKIDSEFYGEVVSSIKQIKLRSFDGEELKQYVEHCIKLNLFTTPDVVGQSEQFKCRNVACNETTNRDNGTVFCNKHKPYLGI